MICSQGSLIFAAYLSLSKILANLANNSPESTSAIHFSAQTLIEKNPSACKVTKFLYEETSHEANC